MKIDTLDAEIGARIAARRRELGMSQAELGAAIGTNQSHVSSLETGSVRCKAADVVLVADALMVEPGMLLTGTVSVASVLAQALAEGHAVVVHAP